MRRTYLLILLLGTAILCNSCGRGVGSLSELCHAIFNALKAGKYEKLEIVVPDKKAYASYLELYEFNQYRQSGPRKAAAKAKADSMEADMKRQFQQTLSIGKSRALDWGTSQLKDYKFGDSDTKEGFRRAEGTLMVLSNNRMHKVFFHAVGYEKKWYLWEKLEMEGMR